jgi:hypothetical protein
MKIFMFASQSRDDLNAFAGDEGGSRLPSKFGPWDLTGALQTRAAPPHRFSRQAIEHAISSVGFQLWRSKPKA